MKLSATYVEYKPSRLSTLGTLPAHWDEISVRHLLLGIKDGTHGTFNRVPNGMPLLSAKNVWETGLRYSKADSQISESDHKKIVSNGYPRKNDVLLTIVGTIGRVCVYKEEQPIAFQRSVCFLRFRESTDPRYFYYFAQSKFFLEQLAMSSKTSAQAGVYMGDVAASIVTRPPLARERQTIVAMLDRETARIDALIEKKTRFIELLKEKRQALITQAVTKGLDPTVPIKDSGVEWIGEVPDGWTKKKVAHSFQDVGSGTTPPSSDDTWYKDGTIPWVTTGELRENVVFDTTKKVTMGAITKFSALRVHPAGSLAIAMYGATIGRMGFWGSLRPRIKRVACSLKDGS